jgi:hypothetical protein
MGKLFNSMIGGILSTLVLLLFNSTGILPTSLFLMMLNPVNYQNNAFYLIFGISGLATLSGGILIGIAAIVRQDWLLRAGIVSSLSSIVIFPYVDLFRFVVAQTNYISSGCTTSPVCTQLNAIGGMGQIFGLIFVGPIILYTFWACVNYIFVAES